jgi:hypothetical protein
LLEFAKIEGTVCLNLDIVAPNAQIPHQGKEMFSLKQRFSPCDTDPFSFQAFDFVNDLRLVLLHSRPLGIARVTPGAPEVAPGKSQERAGITLVLSFSLDTPEYLRIQFVS